MNLNISEAKKNKLASYAIFIGIIIISTLEWHFYDWYQTFTKFGTLITFFTLAAAFLILTDIKRVVKDKWFFVMCLADLIAIINLLALHSRLGSWLVVIDFTLILYLYNYLRFDRNVFIYMLCYVGAFFIYWTIDVKGYFKGYNTNYGGLVLISGFAALCVLSAIIKEYIEIASIDSNSKLERTVAEKRVLLRNSFIAVQLIFVIIAFKIISWYRSRSALVGLIVVLFFMLLPRKIFNNKGFYLLVTFFATIGSIVFSGSYLLLAMLKNSFNIQIFYKDIISGRDTVWGELWQAFSKNPILGIGSSYQFKLEKLRGMLEVHSGLLDILIVHGVIVFIFVLIMLISVLLRIRVNVVKSNVSKACFAALMCMFITGFFENYFIVQPYSLILLVFMAGTFYEKK